MAEIDRCPRCGTGDLFHIEVGGLRGEARRAVYCAGLYDRLRRRFLRRSCGFAEQIDGSAPPPGRGCVQRGGPITLAPIGKPKNALA